jgi:hypothetical protein
MGNRRAESKSKAPARKARGSRNALFIKRYERIGNYRLHQFNSNSGNFLGTDSSIASYTRSDDSRASTLCNDEDWSNQVLHSSRLLILLICDHLKRVGLEQSVITIETELRMKLSLFTPDIASITSMKNLMKSRDDGANLMYGVLYEWFHRYWLQFQEERSRRTDHSEVHKARPDEMQRQLNTSRGTISPVSTNLNYLLHDDPFDGSIRLYGAESASAEDGQPAVIAEQRGILTSSLEGPCTQGKRLIWHTHTQKIHKSTSSSKSHTPSADASEPIGAKKWKCFDPKSSIKNGDVDLGELPKGESPSQASQVQGAPKFKQISQKKSNQNYIHERASPTFCINEPLVDELSGCHPIISALNSVQR